MKDFAIYQQLYSHSSTCRSINCAYRRCPKAFPKPQLMIRLKFAGIKGQVRAPGRGFCTFHHIDRVSAMFKLSAVLVLSAVLASSWAMNIPSAAQEHLPFEFQYQDALTRNAIASRAAPVSRH